jgi:hypothetical protein
VRREVLIIDADEVRRATVREVIRGEARAIMAETIADGIALAAKVQPSAIMVRHPIGRPLDRRRATAIVSRLLDSAPRARIVVLGEGRKLQPSDGDALINAGCVAVLDTATLTWTTLRDVVGSAMRMAPPPIAVTGARGSCSHCWQPGHNRRTCPRIAEDGEQLAREADSKIAAEIRAARGYSLGDVERERETLH